MQRNLPPVGTVLTGLVVAIVGFFSSFPIVLQGLTGVGATSAQAASGLMFAAFAMGIAGIVLSLRYRMPVSVAWSTPGVALLAVAVPGAYAFPEAITGFIFAGALTVLAGLWKPLGRLATSIPAPLAQAMVAGILVVLCAEPFIAIAETPATALPIVLIWFVASRINRLFAAPAAVVAAIAVTLYANGVQHGPACIACLGTRDPDARTDAISTSRHWTSAVHRHDGDPERAGYHDPEKLRIRAATRTVPGGRGVLPALRRPRSAPRQPVLRQSRRRCARTPSRIPIPGSDTGPRSWPVCFTVFSVCLPG